MGGRDRKIVTLGQTEKKLTIPYLKNKQGVVGHACNLSYREANVEDFSLSSAQAKLVQEPI
jgi:hypothetical protein